MAKSLVMAILVIAVLFANSGCTKRLELEVSNPTARRVQVFRINLQGGSRQVTALGWVNAGASHVFKRAFSRRDGEYRLEFRDTTGQVVARISQEPREVLKSSRWRVTVPDSGSISRVKRKPEAP